MTQKKMIIIGEPTGRSDKWSQIWEKWAEENGYEIVRKSLSEICNTKDENLLVVMDEYGLNDDPLPDLGKAIVAVDRLDMVLRGQEIHRRIASHELFKQMLVTSACAFPSAKELAEVIIQSRPEPVKPHIAGRERTGRGMQSKGERKGNRRYRWC